MKKTRRKKNHQNEPNSFGLFKKYEVVCHLSYVFSDQLDKMNDEQITRFEFFMRSHFKRGVVKELIKSSLQPRFESVDVSDEMAITVAALAKLYVGELVETG